MLLSDADKTKKLSEYLGITGTDAEIQEKMEDSEAARDVISQIFEYRADDLFHNRKPYPFVVEKLAGMTLGEIERDKDTLLRDLKGYYDEMLSDYNEDYGDAKRKPFLEATGYDSKVDGDEKGYFFKFWRSPLTKLLDYRKLDIFDTADKEKINEILGKLFGPETTKYNSLDLISKTPETLVEDKDVLARESEARKRTEETEKELLKTKPFYETLTQLDNIHFSNNDPATMAHEAFLQPDAHKRLKELMGTKEKLDEETFIENISKTPQQISQEAEEVAKDPLVLWPITLRNDQKFIADNPGKTFADLLQRDGRTELPFGEDAKNATMRVALRSVLGKGPVDDKAVKKAMDRPLSELVADADKIVADVQKRAKRNKVIVIGSLIVSAITAAWGIGKMFSGNENTATTQPEPAAAPVVQQAPTTQAPDQTPKAGISGALSAVSNQVAAIAGGAQAPDSTPPSAAKKLPMPEKGNRLVAMQWAGYSDRTCRTVIEEANEWLLTGEFDNMFHEIKSKGLPYGDIYDRFFMSKALGRLDNIINVGGAPGAKPLRFYIKRDGGRTTQAIMQDVLNWHDNMNDVLSSLPVSKENLIQAQLRTMDAIGPALGFSIKQELGWQMANPTDTKKAKEGIAQLMAAGIQERNVDTNNVEAVYMEAINAASIYRQKNPMTRGLFLIVDEMTRKTAGIEIENMAKFDQVQKPQPVVAPRPDSAIKSVAPQQQQPKVVVKKEGYSLWWVAAGVALGMYLMSVRAKRKNQIVK